MTLAGRPELTSTCRGAIKTRRKKGCLLLIDDEGSNAPPSHSPEEKPPCPPCPSAERPPAPLEKSFTFFPIEQRNDERTLDRQQTRAALFGISFEYHAAATA